jgi:hypothetical protein
MIVVRGRRRTEYLRELAIDVVELAFPGAVLSIVGEGLGVAGLGQLTLRADGRAPLSVAITRDSGLARMLASTGALSRTGFVAPEGGRLAEAWRLTVNASDVTAHWGATLVDAAWQTVPVAESMPNERRRSRRPSTGRVGTMKASLLRVVARCSGRTSVHIIAAGREVVIELMNTTALEIDISAPAVPLGLLEVTDEGLSFSGESARVQITGNLIVPGTTLPK